MLCGSLGVGLELADVVQQRAGDRDVAVDARERRADRADRLGDAEAVLEQAVPVGLVVVLRGRRDAVAGPQLRAVAEHALEQRRAGAGSWIVAEQLAQVALHLLDRARRAVEQILEREAARRPRAQARAG